MGVLIVGACGAVGKRLLQALSTRGTRVVAADRLPVFPPQVEQLAAATEPNVDVRDGEALRRVLKNHPEVNTIWNLAAPLSVETALDPSVANEITIGGMRNVLESAVATGTARRICFTDSIGSFGASSPRQDCSARWLAENPNQDPGSDYGIQKRGCRELMQQYQQDHGLDTRFAVLPGVLHSEALWGNGTTEYALEALQAASWGQNYVCPLDLDVRMPMVWENDLMRGLLALMDAPAEKLCEPGRGYVMPGLSFTARELFEEIRKIVPEFKATQELDEIMNKFSKIWPDTLSSEEVSRDLGYSPRVGLAEMVQTVLAAHAKRNKRSRLLLNSLDIDGDGHICQSELETFLSAIVSSERDEGIVSAIAKQCFDDMDKDHDGAVSIEDFQLWSKSNSLLNVIDKCRHPTPPA